MEVQPVPKSTAACEGPRDQQRFTPPGQFRTMWADESPAAASRGPSLPAPTMRPQPPEALLDPFVPGPLSVPREPGGNLSPRFTRFNGNVAPARKRETCPSTANPGSF